MAKKGFNAKSLAKYARGAGELTGKLMGRAITSGAGEFALSAMEKLGKGDPNNFMTLAAQAIKAKVEKLASLKTQAYALPARDLREQPKGSLTTAFRDGLSRGAATGVQDGKAAKAAKLERKRTPGTKAGFVPT